MAQDSILIQNGRILDPSSKIDAKGDILIRGGQIIEVSLHPKKIQANVDRKIDATGKWVLPGLIDLHVHLREPGLEYKETIETGTAAAVAGGFTSVACMANTQPINDSAYITSFMIERAKTTGNCRVFPIGAITKGLKGEEISEMGAMYEAGAVGFSDDGLPVMNSYLMRKAMDYSKAFGAPIITHSEDLNLVGQGVMNEGPLSSEMGLRGNPAAAEEIMVARDLSLARMTECRLHIAHVSTKLAVEQIRRAKEIGLSITAEVTPHHLTLTEKDIRSTNGIYDTRFKMAPPLRTQEDVDALRAALADGTIDTIGTDHAPHAEIDKAVEFDHAQCGVLGLQTAVPVTLSLVHEGILQPLRWAETLTSAPAKIIKLPHGSLKKGAAADVTVIDPEKEWTLSEDQILSKSRNSPFVGRDLKGSVVCTFVEGKLVYENSH